MQVTQRRSYISTSFRTASHVSLLGLSCALALSACASGDPAKSDSASGAPTTSTAPTADDQTSSPEPSTSAPSPAFDTATHLDMLWDSSDEHIGLCVLWRDDELTGMLSEQDVPLDLDEVDDYFAKKCEAVPDGTRARPFPSDTDLVAGDWKLRVVDVELDAWQVVQAENQFNDPPASDHQYVLLSLEVEYEGTDEPVDPWRTFDLAVVGAGGNTFTDNCGVIPQPLREVGDMYVGATATGNVCIEVVTDQVESSTVRIGAHRADPVFVLLDPAAD